MAVVIHEFITKKGEVGHKISQVLPSYEDAVKLAVDYYDSYYITKNFHLLPSDLQIVYDTSGLTWGQYELVSSYLNDRFLYIGENTYDLGISDFVIGPGVRAYHLETVPIGYRYLFDTLVFSGAGKSESVPIDDMSSVFDKDEIVIGRKTGPASSFYGAGEESESLSYSSEDEMEEEEDEEETDEEESLEHDSEGDDIESMYAIGAGDFKLHGHPPKDRPFKIPASIAGGEGSDIHFDAEHFVDENFSEKTPSPADQPSDYTPDQLSLAFGF